MSLTQYAICKKSNIRASGTKTRRRTIIDQDSSKLATYFLSNSYYNDNIFHKKRSYATKQSAIVYNSALCFFSHLVFIGNSNSKMLIFSCGLFLYNNGTWKSIFQRYLNLWVISKLYFYSVNFQSYYYMTLLLNGFPDSVWATRRNFIFIKVI